MKTFEINKTTIIVCNYQKTRNGFKHTATLIINNNEIDNTKICYQNRTWESYEYETVLHKLLDKTNCLSKEEKEEFRNKQQQKSSDDLNQDLKLISNIAKLGELFCNTTKDKNDWKKRMLQAGISGLDIPSNWDTLSETEKEQRLNKVIEYAGGKE
ncbi:MAG: hypothetical protein WCL18_10780 [bacterium]